MPKQKRGVVVVKDKMQDGYRYELTEPMGKIFPQQPLIV
jgi:hypothetical protein